MGINRGNQPMLGYAQQCSSPDSRPRISRDLQSRENSRQTRAQSLSTFQERLPDRDQWSHKETKSYDLLLQYSICAFTMRQREYATLCSGVASRL